MSHWEYWPFGIIHFPAILYYLWLSIRSRSLVFFSASNPGITMGGMFGESKFEVLKKIPDQFVPKTVLMNSASTVTEVRDEIHAAAMNFPVIFKPDIGERGFMVKKIAGEREIVDYLAKVQGNFVIQEWLPGPLEFGIFYMRLPKNKNGKVHSVVVKEMLSVKGDGKATLQELIFRNDRAKLQWKTLKITYRERLQSIIPKGEKLELVFIGNHALGTRFIDGNHLINDTLSGIFDEISRQISGFYFGRFDLRCATIQDLYEGKIKIMELNGCGAEPAHIYDQNFSIFKAVSVLVVHWHHIYKIARENRASGVKYLSHKEAWTFYQKFRSLTK